MQRPLMFCLALIGATLAATSSPAIAGIVFSDDFSTNGTLVGTTPDVGGAWGQSGATATNPIQVVSNAAAVGPTGQDTYAAFLVSAVDAPGTYLHTSFDLAVSAVGTGDYFLHLSDPVATTTNFYQRFFAKTAVGGFNLGLVDTSGTGSTVTYGSGVLTLGSTNHIDINWNFVPGLVNDTFDVLVNGLPYLTHTWTSVTAEPTLISAVNLRQGGGAAAAPTVTVDNLQVEIVPEPTSLTLLVLGALAFVGKRRNR